MRKLTLCGLLIAACFCTLVACSVVSLEGYSTDAKSYDPSSPEGLDASYSILVTLRHIKPAKDDAGFELPPADKAAMVQKGMKKLYRMRCTRCHSLVQPNEYPAADWPDIVDEFGPRSGLRPAEHAALTAWLVEEARKN